MPLWNDVLSLIILLPIQVDAQLRLVRPAAPASATFSEFAV